jgi:hypothetical protein
MPWSRAASGGPVSGPFVQRVLALRQGAPDEDDVVQGGARTRVLINGESELVDVRSPLACSHLEAFDTRLKHVPPGPQRQRADREHAYEVSSIRWSRLERAGHIGPVQRDMQRLAEHRLAVERGPQSDGRRRPHHASCHGS